MQYDNPKNYVYSRTTFFCMPKHSVLSLGDNARPTNLFADNVDQDQTAQIVQPDLGSLL